MGMTRQALWIVATLFVTLWTTARSAAAAEGLSGLFNVKKPIIAALALKLPRPSQLSTPTVRQSAISYGRGQMQILAQEGVDAVIWEVKGGGIESPRLSAAQIEWMTTVIKEITNGFSSPLLGVEILWHYPRETLRLAKDVGARFVRIDFFSDEMIADGHRVAIDPEALLSYRHAIAADDIALVTDIQVKYAEMVDSSISIEDSARKAIALGSDGVSVSGEESGVPPSSERVRLAKVGAGSGDVIIGSGLAPDNAASLLQHADAAFVGTSISRQTGGPLVPEKVRQLMAVVRGIRN